jgi:hypothetical protein
MNALFQLAGILFLNVLHAREIPPLPEQVHIELGDQPDSMTVQVNKINSYLNAFLLVGHFLSHQFKESR